MTLKTAVLLTLTGMLASTCLAQPATTQPSKDDLAAVVDGSNSFAADLYAKLAADKKGNLFFSPGSIHTALAMTYAGAAGNTADQMAKTLHFTLPPDKLNPAFAERLKTLNNPPQAVNLVDESGKQLKQPAYQLMVANALWGQKGYAFKPEFTQLLQKSYGAGLNDVDFAKSDEAAKTINDWVAQQTKDKIKDLIPKGVLNDLTRLVLTNAIYFKSNWAEKFYKEATKDGPFKLTADKSADVPMMHLKKRFGYMENDDFQMLELPYTQRALSMVIVLPKKVEGLADVEKLLTAANIAKWLSDCKWALVEVTLPKFKFSSDFMLKDALTGMGMTDAFDPNKAVFSGMTSSEKLSIAAVIHKAFLAVDEEGTEAAAATAVVMHAANGHAPAPPEEPKVFKADHPFIFMIRHNATGEILFMGRLANPKGE